MTANYDEPVSITVPVHIVGDDTRQEKRPKEIRTSHRTYVLTAIQPYVQIVGFDPARKLISINVADSNPVIVCGDITQASDAANTAPTAATPNGRIVTQGLGDVGFLGQDEMWIAGGTYPTRVGVTITREI